MSAAFSTTCVTCGCAVELRRKPERNAPPTRCGSCFRKRHGLSRSPTYRSWMCMRVRCESPSDINYDNYGGRGIKVCERWLSFQNFLDDMGVRPDGTSIDRIDSSKGYEPGNCRWATSTEQGRNRRSVKLNTDKVHGIRTLHALGFRAAVIAAVFGISRQHASSVCTGETWSAA